MSSLNLTTAVFLINNKVRAVQATYESNAHPEVFKTFDTDIIKDDLVIVPTNTRHNFTVVKVVAVDVDVDYDSTHQMKWIVGKVDKLEYDRLLREEQMMVDKIKSAEKNKRKIELAKSLLADNDELRTLPIATAGEPSPPVT